MITNRKRRPDENAPGSIGIQGDGRLDPDPTTIPGTCSCGGETWPMDDGAGWQCEQCGEYTAAA